MPRMDVRAHRKKDEGKGCAARRGRRGFTLVELIVVLALIGILAAVSAGGMLAYTRFAKFKQNNENARTLFSAAQSAITYYKASGRLEELREKVKTFDTDPKYVPNAAFAADREMNEQAGSPDVRRDGTISYLMLSKADGEKIIDAVKGTPSTDLTGTALEGKQAQELYKLLRDYVTDTSIYDASICLEFDATEGVVSGVLYCDRAGSFTYGSSSGDANAVDITDRRESHREDIGLGYYSTALSARTPESLQDLSVENVNLKNAETMDVQWFLEEDKQYLKGNVGYHIVLTKKKGEADTTAQPLVEFTLEQEDVMGISVEDGNAPYVKATDVKLYGYDTSGSPTTPANYELNAGEDSDESDGIYFHAYLVQDETHGRGFALSLDALDLELANVMQMPTENAGDLEGRQKALAQTYSAHRLSYTDSTGNHYGLNLASGEEIQVSVSILGNTGEPQSSASSFVLFASEKKEMGASGKYDYTYGVANARHLYNVRFRELDESGATASDAASITYQIVGSGADGGAAGASGASADVAEIAWGGPNGILSYTTENPSGGSDTGVTVPQGRAFKVFSGSGAKKDGIDLPEQKDGKVAYPAFPSIICLNKNSKLTSADAGADAGADPADGSGAGTDKVAVLSYFAFEPEREVASDGTSTPNALKPNVGLVQENKGTIEDVRLAEVDVRGIVKENVGDATDGALLAANNVGAICGINNGTLTNVKTISGHVTGGANVGGVVGTYGAGAEPGDLSGMYNGAQVGGLKNVGGIVGGLDDAGGTERNLSSNKNTGIVYGYALPEGKTLGGASAVYPLYIGGIVGSVEGSVTISNCVSSPRPQGGAGTLAEEDLQALQNGNLVGGIIGKLASGQTVQNCVVSGAGVDAHVPDADVSETDGIPSGAANPNAEGYVLGNALVGGFVGYNEGGTILGASGTSGVDPLENVGICGAQVIGSRFVGGIVGANGKLHSGITNALDALDALDEELQAQAQALSKLTHGDFDTASVPSGSTVTGLTFQGLVAAKASLQGASAGVTPTVGVADVDADADANAAHPAYVGGLAGANFGTLSDCKVAQDDTESLKAKRGSHTLAKADYVGGLVGYHAGAVHYSEPSGSSPAITQTIAVVEGRNYVGGLVGYNDDGSADSDAIANCQAKVEAVAGENFVGGLAGVNASLSLVSSPSELSSAAWEVENVTGRSYVGGFAGANLLEATEDVTISARAAKLGSVSASGAFVGGLFGYSRLLGAGEAATLTQAGGLLPQLLAASGQNDGAEAADGTSAPLTETQLVQLVTEVFAQDMASESGGTARGSVSGKTLTIDGQSMDMAQAGAGGTIDAGEISGQLFVGGAVGYHAQNAKFVIKNYVTKDSVSASAAIPSAAVSSEGTPSAAPWSAFAEKYGAVDALGQPKRYSFSGGILGYVTKDAQLVSCQSLGEVRTAGTYLGGLAEVNEGLVQACQAAQVGGDDRSYVGGVVGLNGYTLDENGARRQGILSNCSVKQRADSTGGSEVVPTVRGVNVVGGLVAENFGVLEGDATAGSSSALGTVAASGGEVGGLVGINRGQIRNIQGVSVNVNAPGAQYVGGIAGTNEGAILGVSTADVMTVTGGSYAGGLVGQNKQPASAQQTPQADADSVQTGLIGDWTTGSADGSPSLTAHCQNLANVIATDTAGGIAGINDAGARIVHASVQGAIVTSGGALGGIAGRNLGAIALADLPLGDVSGGANADGSNSTGVTLKADNATYVGGIVGENLQSGVIQSAETKEETISVGQQVGIAEGLSGDEIVPGDQTTDASVADGYAEVSLDWTGSAVAAMGGIAGKNDGRIDSVRFTGRLAENVDDSGTGDGIVAYGGIAGTNNGTIQDCGLGGADLGLDAATGAMPKEAALSSGAQTYLGGIAGANGPKGKILAILEDETKTRHAKVDIVSNGALATGGIVGYNEGQVGRAAATTVGGSAGSGKTQQGQDADVEKTQDVHSGSNWSIRATGEGSGPVGGIIGIQSGNELYHVRNLAGLTEREVTDGQSAPSGVQSAGDVAGGIIGSVRTLLQADSLTGLEENEPQVKIEFCVNEGPVTARAHAGGIVGEWASAANGRLGDCANGKTREYEQGKKTEPGEDFGDTDARIQVTGIEKSGKPGKSEGQNDTFVAVAAAGILADCKDLAEGQRLSLVHCANFGIVSKDEQPGAGIAALTGGLAKLQNPSDDNVQIEDGQARVPAQIVVEDCANAGRAKTGAGIALLYGEGAKDIALTVQQCRNYGRPPVAKDGAGDAADEKDADVGTFPDAEDAFAGIFAAIVPGTEGKEDEQGRDTVISRASNGLEKGQVTIQHCFGVADVKYPIVPIAEEDLTEEQLKEEQERLAGLFNSTSSGIDDDTNNYYYHVGYEEGSEATDPEGDVWPVPMGTAAIASAVSYQNGFYLGFGEEESNLHQDRAYLRALSKWTSDFPNLFVSKGDTFDPNSAKTTDETSGATYREDCRGNYNRLEQWLQEACKQLADGKRENPKWLEKPQLSIRLIGETQGASSEAVATEGDGTVSAEPIYGILLENLRDYRFAQLQNQLALALEITYLGGGTDAGAPAAEGAQAISVQIPFEKLRDEQGNAVVCALTAEGLGLTENAEGETGAATIIGDGVRGTIKLEAWVCQAQASAPTPENEILGSGTSEIGTLGSGTSESGTPETEDGVKSAHLVAVCNLPDAAGLQALSTDENVQMVRQTSGESDPQTDIAVDPLWDATGEAMTPETAADSEAAMGGDAVTGGDTAVGDETVIGSDIAVDGETVTGSDIAVDEEAVTGGEVVIGGEAVIGGDTTAGGEATIGNGTGGVQVMDVGTGEAGEQETTVAYVFAVKEATGASYAVEVLQDSTVGSQMLKNEVAPFAILGDGDGTRDENGFIYRMLEGSAESTGRMYPIGLNPPAAETAQILGAEWIQGDLLGQETQATDVVPVQFGHVVARGLSFNQLMTAGATVQGGMDGSAGASGAAGVIDQSEPNGTTEAGGTGETSGTSGPYIEPASDGTGAYVPADGYSIRKDEDSRFTVYESPLLRSDSTLGAMCVRTVNSDTSSIGQTVLYEAEDPLAGENETEPETQGAQDTEVATEPETQGAQDAEVATEPETQGAQDTEAATEPETQGAQDAEVATEPETQGAKDEEVVTEPETQGIQDTDASTEAPDGTTNGTEDSQEVVVQPASPVEEETETQGEVQTEAELLLTSPEGARLNLDWTVTSQTDAQGGSLAVPESVFQNQLTLTAIPGAAAQTTDAARAWNGADATQNAVASGALDGTDAAQAAGTDGARKDADAAKATGGASTAEGVASQGHYEMLAGFYGDAPQEVRSQIEAQTVAAGGQMPSAGQAWNGQSMGAVQAWNGQSAGAVQIWNDLSDTEMIVSGGSDQAAGQSDAGAAGNVATGNVQIVGGRPDAGLAAGAYFGSSAIFGGAPDTATLLSGFSLYDGQTKIALDGSTYQFQNLPIDYAGSYLCVRFRAVSSDGVQASAWSDCLWMRMPKASIQTEGIFQTTLTSDYGMEVTDETGALLDLKTVSLTHPALAWKLELPDGMNAGDAGWHLAFYQFVDADVPKDAPEYDAPAYSFDLLRSPDGKGYQIERALTEEEAEEWKKEHPDELMPPGLHRTILLTEDADLYAQEHETNKKLKKAYTLSLDALALGTDVAVSTYAQSLSGLGSCAIANICPQIRVMEYEKDVEKGIRKDYVWVWLALPDVRQDMPFLYDYTALSRTHSVTVEPLLQSRYVKQYEGVEAKRLQLTWVIRKEDLLQWEQQPIVPETAQLDAEKIQSYQRVLDEGQSVNDAFDSQYEKEQNGFLDAEQYVLLPREYAKELADRDADVGAEPPATTQDSGVSPNQGEDGGILFEDDGVVFEEGEGATGFAASPETELLGIGIETEAEEEETAGEETGDADAWTDGAGQPAPDAGGLVLEDAVGIGIRDGGNGA